LEGLQGKKDELEEVRTQVEEAKQKWNEYNPAAIADRPADWTEDLAIMYEDDYFGIEAYFKDIEREVKDVEKIKGEAEAAIADQ